MEAEFILGNYLMLPTNCSSHQWWAAVHPNKDKESDLDTVVIPGINSHLPKGWTNLVKKGSTQHIWHARRGELEPTYSITYGGRRKRRQKKEQTACKEDARHPFRLFRMPYWVAQGGHKQGLCFPSFP